MGSVLFTQTFWFKTGVRAVKTFAQTALGLMTGAQVGLLEVDWVSISSVAAFSAIYSVVSSIASADEIVPPALPRLES